MSDIKTHQKIKWEDKVEEKIFKLWCSVENVEFVLQSKEDWKVLRMTTLKQTGR